MIASIRLDHLFLADEAEGAAENTDPAAAGPRPFHAVDHGGSVIITYDLGG